MQLLTGRYRVGSQYQTIGKPFAEMLKNPFCLSSDVARCMPEKWSNNRHGKKEAGTEARLLFSCPIQGRNE
ncbi:hypothetical protein [Pseudomonas sp. HLT2-19-2]